MPELSPENWVSWCQLGKAIILIKKNWFQSTKIGKYFRKLNPTVNRSPLSSGDWVPSLLWRRKSSNACRRLQSSLDSARMGSTLAMHVELYKRSTVVMHLSLTITFEKPMTIFQHRQCCEGIWKFWQLCWSNESTFDFEGSATTPLEMIHRIKAILVAALQNEKLKSANKMKLSIHWLNYQFRTRYLSD
jgi:hypothetical protein